MTPNNAKLRSLAQKVHGHLRAELICRRNLRLLVFSGTHPPLRHLLSYTWGLECSDEQRRQLELHLAHCDECLVVCAELLDLRRGVANPRENMPATDVNLLRELSEMDELPDLDDVRDSPEDLRESSILHLLLCDYCFRAAAKQFAAGQPQ